jgi:group I intron endonuclease
LTGYGLQEKINSNLCEKLIKRQNANFVTIARIRIKTYFSTRYHSSTSTTTSNLSSYTTTTTTTTTTITSTSTSSSYYYKTSNLSRSPIGIGTIKRYINSFPNLNSEENYESKFHLDNSNLRENSKILTDFIRDKQLSPVYCYDDLHLDSTRKRIQRDTKNMSGIYLILNKVTLDYYIGSASTNRFYARLSNHLLYFRGSKIVKLAVRKYKLAQFAFIILEIFNPDGGVVNKKNNKDLLNLEDFYLKSLLPNYNILTEAGSSFGYKHTEISRLKMKAVYSQERRDKIGSLNRGTNFLKETIEKMRSSALTRDKLIYSDEAILNMKQKSKPIIIYNLDKTVYGEFTSIVEAANSINCSEKTIIRALKTDKKILKRRWIVNYV